MSHVNNDTNALPFFSAQYDQNALFIETPYPNLTPSFFLKIQSWFFGAYRRQIAYLQKMRGAAPPNLIHPMTKSKKQTFNHMLSFVLDDQNRIWYAPRTSPHLIPNWKLLYFDGLPENTDLEMEIKADGANLMVKVLNNNHAVIHYKKILKESTLSNNGINRYVATSLCESPKSISGWFSLPIIKYFQPRFLFKLLSFSRTSQWAMSHTNIYRKAFIHQNGKKQNTWPVTTLYELKPKSIMLHDPFVPHGITFEIAYPNTDKGLFKPKSADASGSMIGLMGTTLDDTPELYTRYIDYDNAGLNPLQRYTFNPDSDDRYLPFHNWLKHELPKDAILDSLTCVQTGEGNDATELRINTRHESRNGFFYKKMSDCNWQFHPYHHVLSETLTSDANSSINTKKSKFYDFGHLKNQIIRIYHQVFDHIHLENFHFKSNHVPVSLTLPNKESIALNLVRKKNMIRAFFGLKSESWELVLSHHAKEFLPLFQNRYALPVNVEKQKLNHDSQPVLVIESKDKLAGLSLKIPILKKDPLTL